MSEHQCLTCKFAEWKRTASGRLHPSGDGKCTWTMPTIFMPLAAWGFNYQLDLKTNAIKPPSNMPIDRNPGWAKYTKCPTYEAKP